MNIILNQNSPKYIQIYNQISEMINKGILKPNEKLPSKRNLAKDLEVSLSTIENAYLLLLDEGYIYTLEKKGYFISKQEALVIKPIEVTIKEKQNKQYKYDFTTHSVEGFNNKSWKKVIKNIIDSNSYLNRTPLMGDYSLRVVISNHLNANRGIIASPDNILITSGMECFNDILKLTKKENIILENPGYHKLKKLDNEYNIIYQALDNEGVTIPEEAGILYTTPFNQFPTGIKMSIARKKDLVNWAKKTESYIIEDDFDAEFRINSKPTTSIYSLLPERVIFFSTFSSTLFPGIRISYAVLPQALAYEKYYQGYSNQVSTLIQLGLRDFINKGYYSTHINSLKKKYLINRKKIIEILEKNNISYDSKKNYLSILVDTKKVISKEFIENLKNNDILINSINDYDYKNDSSTTLIIGYTAIATDRIEEGLNKLINEIKKL